MHGNISNLIDCLADPAVKVLIVKSLLCSIIMPQGFKIQQTQEDHATIPIECLNNNF